ncbi:hypothetical protein DNL40_09120 [Xylanimonas oleitrophica]|uniref:Alpha-galactosidase NEW3 domain-containing protein n=1 Tax=Xylanimonas oleitrophica TaxID=2607479 RepID=A0A2W5WNM4_9MICO|nr:DUF6049 family protein [Xylanimonas oleitrophica]PZR53149.1 hypothetical protein DNL40_09120 [Xylanimonas oleitrophica]
MTRAPRAPRAPVRRRLVRALAAAALVVGAGLAPALAGPTTGASAAAPAAPSALSRGGEAGSRAGGPARAVADDGAPTLQLQQVTPQVARPGDTLAVTVRVTNPGARTLDDASLDLGAGWKAIQSRTELAGWTESTSRLATPMTSAPVASVAPGASTDVRIELPVDRLALGTAARGPREMSVALRDASGSVVASLHTFLLWDPDPAEDAARLDPDDQVRLSLLAPVTGPALDPADTLAEDDLAEATAGEGSLSRVLDAVEAAAQATGTRGALALAVDPAVVADASASEDSALSAWAARVGSMAEHTDVHPLPPYDPDLAALAHADLPPHALAATVTTPLRGGWSVPETWGSPLAWPAGGADADLATLDGARGAGLETVVLPTGLSTARTSPGLARVETATGEVTALVGDEALGQVLAAGTDRRAAATDEPLTTAEAVQRLLAETAVVATQSTEEAHLVVALPRGWTPDLTALRNELSALTASGWVSVVPLNELLSTPTADVVRAGIDDLAPQPAELSPDAVRRLDAARAELTELATVSPDPQAVTSQTLPSVVAPLSVAWRSVPQARDAAVTVALDVAAAQRRSVTVVPRTVLSLISAAGDLPVVVRNDLPTDATVTVVLRPDDPRLVVDAWPTATVPANGAATVNVPVRAIASGDVEIEIQVLTPTGFQAAEPASLEVRVRAGWETAGTVVVAAGVGLLFLVGIWRTVRRGRSPRRTTTDVPAPVNPADAQAVGSTDAERQA